MSEMQEPIKEEDTGIALDLDILEQQQKTTTPLEELYGYSAFSKSFQNNITKYQKKQKEVREQYFRDVLTNQPEDQTETVFQSVFTAETKAAIKVDEEIKSAKENPAGAIGFILVGMILTGGILMLIDRKIKGRRTHETDNYDYSTQYGDV